ncbi:MAG: type 1 glutamine amidotransferase [Phycisphaera sp.]|nr:type 1 glutamine amidotransferase [Phycisphaera sp.]
MAITVFQHTRSENAGRLGRILTENGHKLRTVELYNGQSVPGDFDNVDGIVSLGGPMNVEDRTTIPWIEKELAYIKTAHEMGLPIVGLCLGAQFIATALGGEVAAMKSPEVGWQNVKLAFPGTIDTLHQGIPWDTMQFHLHGQEVTKLPPGGTPLSGSKACRTQAFKVGLRTYAYQYHFEWDLPTLQTMVKDELIAKAGSSADEILSKTTQYYDTYRRLGDRMCENIALFLFPVLAH